METIQHIFRDVQDNFTKIYTLPNLSQQLDTYEIEFRSIAYEAASFCIALKDLEAGNELSHWKSFLQEIGSLHATQIHVGLGWAFAQKQIDPSSYLSSLEPMLRYRVLDGYGYYEGIFRQRKSILSQQKLELQDAVASGAYDQGLGRSLWYINQGKIDETKNMLEKFPATRHNDLWRGLAIAIAYVGGYNKEALQQIFDKAGEFKTQLAGGAAMALISRYKADFTSDDTKQVAEIWCRQSNEEIILSHNKSESHNYANWISKIESSFLRL